MNLIKTKSFTLSIYSQGDPNAEKFALVLPGKLDTKDYAGMRSNVEYLAKRGFYALSFDPPGTWESPGDINIYNMTNYLKAIDELIVYYGNKPTFIMGHSRGAAIATIAGVRNEHAIAFASVFSALRVDGSWEKVDTQAWKERGYFISMRDLPPGGGPKVKEFRLPYSFYEDQLQYNITGELKKSRKPKLFFLATRDEIINPETIRELYSVAAEPKEFHEIDCVHDYRLKQEWIDEVNQTIGNFLDKYQL